MQGMPIVQASSQAWATVGSMWSSGFNSGWILDQSVGAAGAFTQSVSPASSGQGFYSTGDALAYYAPGRMLKVIDGGGTHYCEVLSSSSSAVAGTTTSTIVTITNVVSGTTTLSTGSLTSVSASPIFATSAMLSNFGPFSTGSASLPGMRFRGSYGGLGLSVDGSTFLGFSVLGTEIFSMSTAALLGAADNTYNIGASGASRPQTAYLGTSLSVGPGTIPANTPIYGSASVNGQITCQVENTNAGLSSSVWLQLKTARKTWSILNYTNDNLQFYDGTANRLLMPSDGTVLQMWDSRGAALTNIKTRLADGTGHVAANDVIWGN